MPNSPSPDALASATDEELVERMRGGDEAALSALYRRYVVAIYRFILAQVRDVADAEDLTSDTFARMLRGISTFRGESSFKNWLYQIARNGVRNHRRQAAYRLNVPLSPDLASVGPDPDPPVARLGRALALLEPLPPRYRQVLELRFLNGRTLEDTAQVMGITVANAKVLQHRALHKAAALHEASIAAE